MKKNLLAAILSLLLSINLCYASFQEHYEAGQAYLATYQYSSAISEFKKALRINYFNDSARIGLVNSYLARGTYFANTDHNYDAAANDFRAALFYLRYYPDASEVSKSVANIENTTKNLSKCFSALKFNTSVDSRFKKAQELRLKGLFAEAGYEFAQCLDSYKYSGSAYEQLGDMMRVLGNVDKVSFYYKKALDINPNLPNLRLKYARALDKNGRGDLALDEYNYALQNGDNDPELLYSLEKIYRQNLLKDENDAPSLTCLGAILQKQNKYDEALKCYNKAYALQPDNIQNKLNMASLYYAKKEYDKALKAYDDILVIYPENVTANLYKAECYIALNKMPEAVTTFKEVLKLSPNDNKVKSQIVNDLTGKLSPDEVISFVYTDSVPQKSDLDNLYSYAFNLHKQNKFDKAIESYKTILKYNDTNPEVYVNLAIAYNQNKDFDNALNTIKLAKSKFPTDKQVIEVSNSLITEGNDRVLSQAVQFYNANNFQEALKVYLSINPQTFDSLVGTATCFNALDDKDNAIKYYKKAMDLKPTSDVAYYMGALYLDKNDLENAKTYLNKSLSLNPSNTNSKDLLSYISTQQTSVILNDAISLFDSNKYNEALALFNKVIQYDSKNAYAFYYRASIYDSQKKYALAISDYQKAVSFNSEFQIANYLIAVDYDILGQYKNALAYYKKYVASTSEDNEYKTYSQQRIKDLKIYE